MGHSGIDCALASAKGSEQGRKSSSAGSSAGSSMTTTTTTATTSQAGTRLSSSSSLGYSVRSDLAQEREPRVFSHRLSLGAALTLLDRKVTPGFDEELADEVVTGSVALAGQYTTLGAETVETQDGIIEMSDLDISLSRAVRLNDIFSARNTLEFVGGNVLPTSTASQYEGVRFAPYLSTIWSLSFRGGLAGLTQAFVADHTVNSFRFSPTTRIINSDLSYLYNVGLTVRLGGGFKLGIGGNARLTHFMDDTLTSSLGNETSVSWSRDGYVVSIKQFNGARAEDKQTNLWFVDEYRRVLSLNLMARF